MKSAGVARLPVHMRRHGGGVPVDGPLLAGRGRGGGRGVGLQQHLDKRQRGQQLELIIFASASQFHIYLPWGQHLFSIVS